MSEKLFEVIYTGEQAVHAPVGMLFVRPNSRFSVNADWATQLIKTQPRNFWLTSAKDFEFLSDENQGWIDPDADMADYVHADGADNAPKRGRKIKTTIPVVIEHTESDE